MSTKKKVAVKKIAKKAPSKKPVMKKFVHSKSPEVKQDVPHEHIDYHMPTKEEALVHHCNKLHKDLEDLSNPYVQVKIKQEQLNSIQHRIESVENEIENLDKHREELVGSKNKIQSMLEGYRKLVLAEIN